MVALALPASAQKQFDEANTLVADVPAFPGAQGFGSQTVGGRGGRVIEVTNLDDSGPGSLRAAITASGPRIVVFRTGGTIETRSLITVTNPFVTIAGQTAPGGGIALKASPSYNQGSLEVRTHDVIIRGLRLRPGASSALSESRRGLLITESAYNVIVDHSSISWATDENILLIDGAHEITIQWSILSEGLSHSTHTGEHSKGMSISGKRFRSQERTRNISVHHSLFAHNNDRNPSNASFGLADVVNNVIYNYGLGASQTRDLQTNVPINYVANYVKQGPSSSGVYELIAGDTGTGFGSRLYVSGNIGPHRTDDAQPQADVIDPADRSFVVQTRFEAPAVTTGSAFQAYDDVLANAGALVPERDAVDQRVVNDAQNGTGRIIDDPSEVGGWPHLAAGSPPPDNDHDGMPDSWEAARGLDPSTNDSAHDRDGDGYTNVEEYINSLFGGSSISSRLQEQHCSNRLATIFHSL